MEDSGIVMKRQWKLAYGWHHGFGRGWLPDKVQRVIVGVWNPVACRLRGHDWFPDFSTADREAQVDGHIAFYGVKTEACSDCRAERPCRDSWVNPGASVEGSR